MLEQDYILRLVKQLAEGLRRIATLRRKQQTDEAWQATSDLAERLVGLDLETLETLPASAILEVCHVAGELDVARAAAAARLCFEAARVREVGDAATASWDKKAFVLFDHLLAADTAPEALLPHRDVMADLFERLG